MERQFFEKERCYVRGLGSNEYNLDDELARLRSLPRVTKKYDRSWRGGPQKWQKNMINPADFKLQSLQSSITLMAPGARSQKHGHQNPALFYVLEGKGYDIHDGERYEWSAGDILIVTPGCVHQHFNASIENPARAIIIKGKPLYNFMNLNFQGFVVKNPKEPVPGWEDFEPSDHPFIT